MRHSTAGRPADNRHFDKYRRRRHLAEQLEPRMLLAGDSGMPAEDTNATLPAGSSLASDPPRGRVTTIPISSYATPEGEAGSLGDIDSFADSLRAAVDEISRVMGAIGSSAALSAEIPYLGSLLPIDVGDSAVIDTVSISSLFDLADRFENEVAAPLRGFLDSVPSATPSQLVAQFDFLEAVPDLAGGVEGVRLNLDLAEQFNSSVAALLEPITARAGGLIDAVSGDALATELPINLSASGLSFDVLRDAADNIGISIPDFSLEFSREDLPPIDFAAQVGFLAGGIVDGEIGFDFGFAVDLAHQLDTPLIDTGALAGLLSLETLSELAAVDISDALRLHVVGDGLNVALPFDFDLSGFDSHGFLPIFTLSDHNPVDEIFPEFDLVIPPGASYTADALLSFHSINATEILGALDQLGGTLGLWQEGSLLNLPFPLADGVTIGDAVGFAGSYGGAVLQFLTDDEGLPSFNSIQELADLIPQLVSDATGETVTYDPETKQLGLSLEFLRAPEDITAQANIGLLAGNESSPIATLQMTPGDSGTDNRVTISRNVSLGMNLQIDLSADVTQQENVVDRSVDVTAAADVLPSTSMEAILQRLGLGQFIGQQQTLQVQLRDGTTETVNMGVADDTVSLVEWLERGTVIRDEKLVMKLEFEPVVTPLTHPQSKLLSNANRFLIHDFTEPAETVTIRMLYSNDPADGANDPTPLSDPDVPHATTLGEARRWVLDRAAEHLSKIFVSSHTETEEVWEIAVSFAPLVPGKLGSAKARTNIAVPQDTGPLFANVDYPLNLVDHLTPDADIPGFPPPHVEATFSSTEPDFDFDVSGPPAEGQHSLFLTAVHEIYHGLGFSSNLLADGSFKEGRPTIFDLFLEDSDGIPLADLNGTRPQSLTGAERAVASVSDDLFFDGQNTNAANTIFPGQPPAIYAPEVFRPGSSRSHFDPGVFGGVGDLQLPYATDGIFVSPMSAGVMADLGYTLANRAGTTVLSSGDFWEGLLHDNTAEDDAAGIVASKPLNVATVLADDDTLLSSLPGLSQFDTGIDNAPLTIHLLDGSTETIDFDATENETIGSLLEELTIDRGGQTVLNAARIGDAVVITDRSDPVGGASLRIERTASGPPGAIESWLTAAQIDVGSNQIVAGDLVPALPIAKAPLLTAQTTLGELFTGTEYEPYLGRPARVELTLGNGSFHEAGLDWVTAETTLGEVLESLQVPDPDDTNDPPRLLTITQIEPGDDRLRIDDRTGTADPAPFELFDLSDGGGLIGKLFNSHLTNPLRQNADRDSTLFSDSLTNLGAEASVRPAPPRVLVDVAETAPAWTSLETFLRRAGHAGEADLRQAMTVSLRDGSRELLTLPGPASLYTIADATEHLKVVRDGIIAAEILLDGDRWVLHDHTSGDSETAVFGFFETFELEGFGDNQLFQVLFDGGKDTDGDGRIESARFSDSQLESLAGESPLTSFLEGYDALQFNQAAAGFFVQFRDGTARSFSLGSLNGKTVLDLLSELTIRRDGQLVLEAWFENGAIQLRDHTASIVGNEYRFGLEWIDETGVASQWPAYFLPFDQDSDDDGVLVGNRLLEKLPSSQIPVSRATELDTILARKLLRDEVGRESQIEVLLRDNSIETLTTGVIEADMTVGELVDRLKIQRGDDTLVDAVVVDDRIALRDLTTGIDNPAGPLTLLDPLDETGQVFVNLGFTSGDPNNLRIDHDGDSRIASDSLATHRVTSQTTLGELFGDDDPRLDDTLTTWSAAVSDGQNRTEFQELYDPIGPWDSATTIQEVLDAVNRNVEGDQTFQTHVSASLVDSQIVVRNGAAPISGGSRFEFNADLPHYADLFFDQSVDTDRDATIDGKPLVPVLAEASVGFDTTLSEFFGSRTLDTFLAPGNTTPLVANLSDGTQVSFTVKSFAGQTFRQYADQFEVRHSDVVVLEATVQSVPRAGRDPGYRFVLHDRTDGTGVDAQFSVVIDEAADTSTMTLLPAFLGLVGFDHSGTGTITGGELIANQHRSILDRITFVESPTLRAEVSATASNVNAEVLIGELLGAGLRDGNGMATAVVELALAEVDGQSLSLDQLVDTTALPADLLEFTVDADLQFGGEVVADFAGLNAVPQPGDEPRIDFDWPNAITSDPELDFQTDTLSFSSQNLEDLLVFDRLSVQDITELVRKIVDLLERISGDDLLDRQLPLVGTSLAEVLDTTDRIAEIVEQIVSQPNTTLDTLEQDLEAMLGLEPAELTLTYLPDDRQIRLDLDLAVGNAEPTLASLNLDLPDVGPLESLVDFQAGGEVTIEAGGELNLHLGLDLDQLGDVDFDDAVVVYDSTGLAADSRIFADDLSFTTTVATLGVDVGPGRVAFDRDGLPFGRPADESPAEISIGLVDSATGTYSLTALSAADFQLDFTGVVGVDLPVDFLGANDEMLQIHWPDLSDFSLTPVDSIDPSGGNQIVVPDFSDAVSDFDLADGVYALVAGLEGLFGLIDDDLGDQVLGIPVPVIGDALGDLVSFSDSFRDRLSEDLDVPGLQAEAARIIIFDTLGPGPGGNGLNILGDLDGNGSITIDDVGFNLVNDGATDANGNSLDEVSYRLRIAQDLVSASTTVDLDVGGTALGLDLEADVEASFGYSFDVGFGISEAAGVFVEFFDGDEISLDLNASVANLMGEGRLGPLAITARTLSPSELTEQQRIDARLDPSDPSSAAINGIKAEYQINLGDPVAAGPGDPAQPLRYSLSELGSIFGSNVETTAAMVGSLHVQVETNIGGAEAGLPSIRADLNLNWEAVEGALSEVVAGLGSPTIQLSNVGLDLGSFISDVIAPVLEPINEFLDPIRPVLEAITTPLPVISDLLGETTFVDFIGLFGDGGQTVAKFVEAAADIARLIDVPIVNGSIFLPLGNFTTTYNDDGTLSANEAGGAFGDGNGFDGFLDTVGNDSVRNYLQGMPRTGAAEPSQPGKFSVPLLTNPASAVGLLLGQDVDLIKYQAPRLEAGFEYSQYIPIWPIFGITIGGSFSTVVDFAFGYDTAGIRSFAESNDPADLLDGFFLDDLRVDQNGNVTDVAELQFRLGLLAGGQLNLVAVSAGVEGGLYAGIDLNLNDPDLDGKVRFQELADNLALGSHPLLGPLWIFDASGKLEAGASIYASAVGFKAELNIGPFTILDFDLPRPEPANPVLGHKETDGTLVVHVGPNAALREEGDLSDGPDDILIAFDEETNETIVSGFGRDQAFSGVTSLFIDSGQQDDNIIIDSALTLPVTVNAGSGSDTVDAGGGPAMIRGGSGSDNLVGSTVADDIDGGSGQDIIDGREGDDLIRGGSGDDQLRGAAGADRIYGDDGTDTLSGNAGSDSLYGGDGDDTINGDEGDDLLVGDREDGSGFGDDFLQGGTGTDVLRGGPRNDQLYGGPGGDQLYGDTGDDLLIGGSAARNSALFADLQATPDTETHRLEGGIGNDRIYGTAGIDIVLDLSGLNIVDTYESNDVITLGDGDDRVRSGSGEDTVNVGDGDNRVFTGAGFDIVIAGNGNDLIDLRPETIGSGSSLGSDVTDAGGQNRILGDSGNDQIVVFGGDNFIDAGDGNNRVTTGSGADTIRTGVGVDTILAGNGDNDINSGAGDDEVTTGSGNDRVRLGSGDDRADTGSGDDVVNGDSGDDVIAAGLGNDLIRGGAGNDVLVGDRGSDTIRGGSGEDIIWGGLQEYLPEQLRSATVHPAQYSADTTVVPLDPIVPAIVAGASIPGIVDDGADLLRGDDGYDIIFGGGGADDIAGGAGPSYIDGGLGDETIAGGSSHDVIRGGAGVDDLSGGGHLDFLYGDQGDDFLRGDGGTGIGSQTFGQKLFGGPGDDVLYAFAPTTNGSFHQHELGDLLDGGDGADELFGNLRQETLEGGDGDDLLEGDGLAGPNYGANPNPLTIGGGDLLLGGPGEDLLLGGGGDDSIWGGGDNDVLEGHAGVDLLAGGTGIDFLYLDVDPAYANGGDTLDGHRDNRPDAGVGDDGATDVLVITGTINADNIRVGESDGQLQIDYRGNMLTQPWRDSSGSVTVEQFQIDGLGGDDTIEFLPSLDLTELSERSRDWIGVVEGGSGNDTIRGTTGRDQINGGPGSDILFGSGGDDLLWGDLLDGNAGDTDTLFAGQGNDDLFGGLGDNLLYAWSSEPGAVGPDFGIFVDPSTGERSDRALPGYEREDTGLNRMLGREGDDLLYAGTSLDFMYGGDGNNTLHDVNGIELEFGIGVPADEEWLEYARSTDKVWYYGGSGSNDVITVDYVTEPGVLGGHHLITRLTENNGFFTYDAQVQLDFAATNADGSRVWNPELILQRVELLDDVEGISQRRLFQQQIEMQGGILPPEGDYLAIIVDAKAGDDQVFVGPTVQRSVWVAAGEGNDRVEFASGTPILVDLADTDPRNEVASDAEDFSSAYQLDPIGETTLFTDLTLDSPRDVDWYEIDFSQIPGLRFGPDGGAISVDSVSADDDIELKLYEVEPDFLGELSTGQAVTDHNPIDPAKPARVEIPLSGFTFDEDFRYFIRIRSNTKIPTQYDLGINLGEGRPLGSTTENLGVETNTFLRRDVIVGGPGADVLQGGPSEDWVIGGDGNDVLSGGLDGTANDLLIGEDGDDILQIIPSFIAQPETLTDELEGSDGYDRILFLGGDTDEFGRPVNDSVTLNYDRSLGRYELAALVWDTANQQFAMDGGKPVVHEAYYRARGVEATLFDLRGGDDEVHLETGYKLFAAHFADPRTYGITAGDRQAGGSALQFEIHGGDGNDRIFGSPYADVVDGGSGIDLILGYGGGDQIFGNDNSDLLIGDDPADHIDLFDPLEVGTVNQESQRNDTVRGATWIDLSDGPVDQLSLHDGDAGDWYIVPVPERDEELSSENIAVQFANEYAQDLIDPRLYSEPTVAVFPAILDPTTGAFYVPTVGDPDAYLLHIRNPRSRSLLAERGDQIATLENRQFVTVELEIEGATQTLETFSIGPGSGIDDDNNPGTPNIRQVLTAEDAADELNRQFDDNDLDQLLFADYDPRLNRIAINSRSELSLTIRGAFNTGIHFLGFEDGQRNSSGAAPLGTYTISVDDVVLPGPPSNQAAQNAVLYQYELATADLDFSSPLETIDLSSDAPSIDAALRIEGDRAQEKLAHTAPIGDINGDGAEDVLMWGVHSAHVFLGEIDAIRGVSIAGDASDYIIALDGRFNVNDDPLTRDGFYHVVPGSGDVDGDGLADLAFYSVSSGGVLRVDVLLAADLADQDRHVAVAALSREVAALSKNTPATDIDFQWLNFNSDGVADLMMLSRSADIPNAGTSVEYGYGGVLDGERLRAAITPPLASALPFELFIGSDTESHITVAGRLDENVRQLGDINGRIYATSGDFDGDGLDEIAVALPDGWRFETNGDGDITVGQVYIVDTDGAANTGVQLGDSVSQPRVISVAQYEPNNFSRTGALNLDQPLLAADLDSDGDSDLVLAREFESDGRSDESLLIFEGKTISTNNLRTHADAAVVIHDLVDPRTTPGLLGLSMSAGDFDGDHQLDLAVGVTADNDDSGSLTLLYNPLTGPAEFSVGDPYGDDRIDSVRLVGLLPGSQLGTLATRSIDITGDRLADLLIGSGSYDGTADGVEADSGAVFVIAGGQRVLPLPDEADVTTLANASVRGIGEVLDDRGTPIVFDFSADGLALPAGESTAWYRFRTVGDGAAGDLLRIGPTAGDAAPVLPGIAGSVTPDGNAQTGLPIVTVGGAANRTGVIEFDLSTLLSAYEDSSEITGGQVVLRGSATAGTAAEVPIRPENLTRTGAGAGFPERVFFSADTDTAGTELWVTEGTAATTRLVIDAEPGSDSGFPRLLAAAGHRLFFVTEKSSEEGPTIQTFFITDGDTTTEIANPVGPQLSFDGATEHNGDIYLSQNNFGGQESQLWKLVIDGAGAATLRQVSDVDDDEGMLNIDSMFSTAAGLFFSRSISDGEQLWISDGSTEGTKSLGTFGAGGSARIRRATAFNDGLLFVVERFGAGEELWFSDGTVGGTTKLTTGNPRQLDDVQSFVELDSSIFFSANDSDLWVTDGTESGTRFVRELFSSLVLTPEGIPSVGASGRHVAAAVTGFGAIDIVVTNADGSPEVRTKITGESAAYVHSLSEIDGLVAIGYRIDPDASSDATEYLALFNPIDGTLQTLSSNDENSDRFEDFVDLDNELVLVGPRLGDVTRNQIWKSNLTSGGTRPLGTTTSGGSAAIDFQVRAANHDGRVTAADTIGDVLLAGNVAIDGNDQLLTIDLAADGIATLRRMFELGYRSIAVTMTSDNGEAQIETADPARGTGLFVTQRAGVVGQLLGDDGRRVADGFTTLDLRDLNAGRYYLGITRPEADDGGAIPLSIYIDPPRMATAHALADNDTIRGGEGDDVLAGRGGRDALFGDSGVDSFVAERFEPRDRGANELLRDPAFDARFAGNVNENLVRNPRVVVGGGSGLRGAVAIIDSALAERIAAALGVPLVVSPSGDAWLAREVRQSDLGGITWLDASSAGITNFDGLQYLVGLETLDLSDNGTLGNFGLTRIAPANNNTSGMPHLRHLNVDGNRVFSLANLQGLNQLTVLSAADQQHPLPLANIAAVGDASQLVYLDVSGNGVEHVASLRELDQLRVADIANNPLVLLGPMTGTYLADDSPLNIDPAVDWTLSFDPNGDSVGPTQYALDTRTAAPSAEASWKLTKLPAGTYEVLATWHADTSHASDAEYEIIADDQFTVRVNQQQLPGGPMIGGKPFAVLGTVSVGDDSEIDVQLRAGDSDGLVIADAIVVRRAAETLPNLRRIDARDTLLDTDSRRFIVGDLAAPGRDVQVELSENQPPRWSGIASSIVIDSTSGFSFNDLTDFVVDPDGTALTLSAESTDNRVQLDFAGSRLRINAAEPIDQPVVIALTATDADGLTADHYLSVVFDAYLVEGLVTDGSGNPVEGALVYNDINDDGDFRGEPATTTGADGKYYLRIADRSQATIAIAGRSNWIATEPIEAPLVSGAFQVVTGVDLGVTRAVAIDLPASASEGTTLTAIANANESGGRYQWSVSGGPVEFDRNDESQFAFTPLDAGNYLVELDYEIDGTSYRDRRLIAVTNVAPVANAGDKVIITEGPLSLTRQIVVDPGADTWDVIIDYGDGRGAAKALGITDRDFDFNHVYADEGTYTVQIMVSNDEGSAFDSFDVLVRNSVPTLALNVPEPGIQRTELAAAVLVTDPSQQADRFIWQYSIDWGDGTVEDIGSSINISSEAIHTAFGSSTHTYADEGNYTITLTVIDDDGERHKTRADVTVINDVPLVSTEVPAEIVEGVLQTYTVSVTDADTIQSVNWDFGDGSGQVTSADFGIQHRYVEPGTYTITVTVDDGEGGVTAIATDVAVDNVDEAPVVSPLERLRTGEGQLLSFTVTAGDPDPNAELSFSLDGAPAGLVIDSESGAVAWTPTVDQGGQRYEFDVIVTDNTSLSSRVPVVIDVIDSGSIAGRIFKDLNNDGRFGVGDQDVAGASVQIDIGDDGTIDQTILSGPDGRYAFNALPAGLYRIDTILPSGYASTTPTTLLVNMETAGGVALPAVGGSDDIDGDGVTNEAEQNSPAGSDGNRDGTPDWLQSHVVSAVSPAAGAVTLVGPLGSTISGVEFGTPPVDPPSGGTFPYGAIRFTVDRLPSGGAANVDLILHDNPSISVVFNYGAQPDSVLDSLYRSMGASIDGDRITVRPHDGAESDFDGTSDGRATAEFLLSDANLAWQNPASRFDVNNDGGVQASDALAVINRLRLGDRDLPPVNDQTDRFYDVNGDGQVSAVDALQIINEIGRRQRAGASEQLEREAVTDQVIGSLVDDDERDEDSELIEEPPRMF